MARTSLVCCLVLLSALAALPGPLAAADSRGYELYDAYFRGHPKYDGYYYRNTAEHGAYARRPDYTQWSGFDKYPLRLVYPVYRPTTHPVHRVCVPCRPAPHQEMPVRKDVTLTADGVPCLHLDCHCDDETVDDDD